MVKKRKTPRQQPKPAKDHLLKGFILITAILALLYSVGFVLYYLFIVVSTGDTPQSNIFAGATALLAAIYYLIIEATK